MNWSALIAIVLAAVALAAVVAVVRWRVAGIASAVHVAATILLLGAGAGIVALSLFDRSTDFTGTNFVPLRSIIGEWSNVNRELAFLNIAGNVLMYAPVGFLLPLATGARWFHGVWVGVALSMVMELLQRVFDSGATDVDDVILNGSGALLGAVAAAGVQRLTPSAHARRTPTTQAVKSSVDQPASTTRDR